MPHPTRERPRELRDQHIASNLMRAKADKHSMRAKRRLAAWDDAYLASLITGAG
jgi:hypothetical protein